MDIGYTLTRWHSGAMRPYTLYLDESGNRNPDKKSDRSRFGRDWFGFGGMLIAGEDNDDARKLVTDFHEKWGLKGPCHMTDMLAEAKQFSWLERLSQGKREEFWRDWHDVLCSAKVIGMGCVVDRPGYVARGYLEKHKESRWLLCRSAFDITVERATKLAKHHGRKLHIVFESDHAVNRIVADSSPIYKSMASRSTKKIARSINLSLSTISKTR
jgi:hypothetical protein